MCIELALTQSQLGILQRWKSPCYRYLDQQKIFCENVADANITRVYLSSFLS